MILIWSLPNNFPNHHLPRTSHGLGFAGSLRKTYVRVDVLGAILLLAATLLLVTALDEANQQFTWKICKAGPIMNPAGNYYTTPLCTRILR